MRMFGNVDQASSSGDFMANFFHYRSCKSLHAMGRATHTHELVYNTKNNMHFEKFAPQKKVLHSTISFSVIINPHFGRYLL